MEKSGNHKRRSKKKTEETGNQSSSLLAFESSKPVARMKISPESKRIKLVDVSSNGENSLNRRGEKKISVKTSPKRRKLDSFTIEVIEDIWKRISSGDVNLYYATVGYGFNGRPVLDHDILVNLLINYGYKINDVMAFIDDFNDVSSEDDAFPMLMMNSHVHEIYEDVKHLDNSVYERDKENNT